MLNANMRQVPYSASCHMSHYFTHVWTLFIATVRC